MVLIERDQDGFYAAELSVVEALAQSLGTIGVDHTLKIEAE